MVKQYFFVGGPEWLGPHNKHGAIIAHAMFGGVYGNFQKDLLGYPPAKFDFYYEPDCSGGDYRRSFRPEPVRALGVPGHARRGDDPLQLQRRALFLKDPTHSIDVNFAISVGMEYKFTRIKRSTKKGNWVSGW